MVQEQVKSGIESIVLKILLFNFQALMFYMFKGHLQVTLKCLRIMEEQVSGSG